MAKAEVLGQGQIDEIFNRFKPTEGNSAPLPVLPTTEKKGGVAHLTCMHCGEKLNIGYESEEKKITSYFSGRKYWVGKPCKSQYGHAFIESSKLKR